MTDRWTDFDRVPRLLWQADVTGDAIRLWCILHAFCVQRDGSLASCVVTLQQLADAHPRTRSLRFVQDRLGELRAAGAVEVVRNTGRGYELRLHPDRHGGADAPVRPAPSRRADTNNGAGQTGTAAPTSLGGRGAISPETPLLPAERNPREEARAREAEAEEADADEPMPGPVADDWHPSFVRFWSSFPRELLNGERQAQAAWRDMAPEQRNAALAVVDEYRAIVEAAPPERRRYFWTACHWLTGAHWSDSLESWRLKARPDTNGKPPPAAKVGSSSTRGYLG